MPEITAINPQKHDKTRCNIEIDGKFFCGMELETVMKYRLKAGLAVTCEELSAIQLESEKTNAFDKALNYLSVSMKTEKQMKEYLQKKGYVEEVIDYAVGKLKEYGYIDDALYSSNYSSSVSKRKGKRLIATELKRKGIEDEVIECALSSIESEEESAENVLKKYLRGKTLDKITMQKAYRYLIGKGFDFDTAKSALKSLCDED